MIQHLEPKLSQLLAQLSANPYVLATQVALQQVFTLIMISSLFLLSTLLPLPDTWQHLFGLPSQLLAQGIALLVVFLVAQELARLKSLEATLLGLLALASFSITTLQENSPHPSMFSPWFGATGIISAIATALISVQLYWCLAKIKPLSIWQALEIPPAVINSFKVIIDGLIILLFWLAIQQLLIAINHPFHATIHRYITTPLSLFLGSYPGVLLVVICISVTWSIGVNASGLIKGFFRPFWYQSQLANLLLMQSGLEAKHIATEQFFDMIWLGGAGATLGLIIAIKLFSTNPQLHIISNTTWRAAIFNINEGVLYGVPVIMNPLMLIAFNILPIILVTTQYWAMHNGWLNKPSGLAYPWPMPPIISGWLTLMSLKGALIQIIYLLIAILLYWPFVKIMDKRYKH